LVASFQSGDRVESQFVRADGNSVVDNPILVLAMPMPVRFPFDAQKRPAIQARCLHGGSIGASAGSAENDARLADAELASDFKLAWREQHGAAKASGTNRQFANTIDGGLDARAVVAIGRLYNGLNRHIRDCLVSGRVAAV
jgi:hypothetical protein